MTLQEEKKLNINEIDFVATFCHIIFSKNLFVIL